MGGVLCLAALVAVAVLLALDFTGGFTVSRTHAPVSAAPLALIAVAYLARQAAHRVGGMGALKTALLASAFLLWSAYQLFPTFPGGPILNDLAIALFVLDVALVVGASSTGKDWA